MKSAARAMAALVLIGWLLAAGAANRDGACILVAKPGAGEQAVGRVVLVVAPLGDDEYVGFAINRPSGISLGKLFPEDGPSQKIVDPVYVGGPVEPDFLFALVQRQATPGGKSFELMPGLYVAYESAIVDRIIKSEPQHARFFAGVVTWQAGELPSEIDQGAWLVLEPDTELLIGEPEGLWERLVRRWQQRMNSI
jgi:putative transcriptional regulator